MAIEKKLIHFSKLSDFQTQLNAGNILEYSIVFIQDAKRIWTRGNYYYCNEVNLDDYLTAEEIAELYATQEWANETQEFINDFIVDIADLYASKQDALVSGENIKTINGQSLLGSGNIQVGHKPLTTTTATSIALSPNVYYRKTNTSSSLTITLATATDSTILNEYLIEFTTASSGTTVSLPSSVKWANGETPTFENSCTYQISIVNNLGVCVKFA